MKQHAVNEKLLKMKKHEGSVQHAEGSVMIRTRRESSNTQFHHRSKTTKQRIGYDRKSQGGIFELAELPFDKETNRRK